MVIELNCNLYCEHKALYKVRKLTLSFDPVTQN